MPTTEVALESLLRRTFKCAVGSAEALRAGGAGHGDKIHCNVRSSDDGVKEQFVVNAKDAAQAEQIAALRRLPSCGRTAIH